jgi:MSHA pilin protein MshC
MLRHRSQGFTLIELVTALLLIAILSAVVINQWPGSTINLSAQADQLVGDIRYTQSLAMNRGQRYRINLAATSYSITDAAGTTPVPHPVTGANSVALNTGIALATTNSFLVFDSNGTPYTSATTPGTPLAADAVITLSADGVSSTIRVSPQTGRVIRQ